MRIRGPCKSSSRAAAERRLASTVRSWVTQRARISGLPCDALMRMTSTPASRSAVICPGSSQAGPRVATILVRRIGERGMA
jgi:hypothetical protein